MTGVLGEYMWRNLDETRRRPRFIVEHTIENHAVAEQVEPRDSHRRLSQAA
jgi:hypothetical protein